MAGELHPQSPPMGLPVTGVVHLRSDEVRLLRRAVASMLPGGATGRAEGVVSELERRLRLLGDAVDDDVPHVPLVIDEEVPILLAAGKGLPPKLRAVGTPWNALWGQVATRIDADNSPYTLRVAGGAR